MLAKLFNKGIKRGYFLFNDCLVFNNLSNKKSISTSINFSWTDLTYITGFYHTTFTKIQFKNYRLRTYFR